MHPSAYGWTQVPGVAAENVNESTELFAGKFVVDRDALEEHLETAAQAPLVPPSEESQEPREPKPFAASA